MTLPVDTAERERSAFIFALGEAMKADLTEGDEDSLEGVHFRASDLVDGQAFTTGDLTTMLKTNHQRRPLGGTGRVGQITGGSQVTRCLSKH